MTIKIEKDIKLSGIIILPDKHYKIIKKYKERFLNTTGALDIVSDKDYFKK